MRKKEDKLIISFLALLYVSIGGFLIFNTSNLIRIIFIILYFGFAFYFGFKLDEIYLN